MSIVTLKKKHKAKQCISNPTEGFSLKGKRRNIKNIGQNQLNSSVRTIFKGTAPTGHGALKPTSRRSCGTTKCNSFPISIIYNQTPASCECLPTSAFTTKGLLLSKIYNPTQSSNDYLGQSGCPKNSKCADWVVKNFNPLDHSQTSYIKKLKVKTASEAAEICKRKFNLSTIDSSLCQNSNNSNNSNNCNNTYLLGTRKINRSNIVDDTIKGAISCSEYTDTMLLMNNCLPTPPCKEAFPLVLNKKFCQTTLNTPEEAIEAGVLPKDWMKCTTKYPINSIYYNNPYL